MEQVKKGWTRTAGNEERGEEKCVGLLTEEGQNSSLKVDPFH